MSRCDEELLKLGKQIGLGDGVTIPVHVPGEAHGSISFVAKAGAYKLRNAVERAFCRLEDFRAIATR
jgi:hypothetical protein